MLGSYIVKPKDECAICVRKLPPLHPDYFHGPGDHHDDAHGDVPPHPVSTVKPINWLLAGVASVRLYPLAWYGLPGPQRVCAMCAQAVWRTLPFWTDRQCFLWGRDFQLCRSALVNGGLVQLGGELGAVNPGPP